jgi:hypothetical protein
MSVIPNKIVSYPNAIGSKGIQTEKIALLPANANSATSYSYNTTNRITFNIPAYPNSWLDLSRTYLSFKCQCTKTGGAATSKVRFNNGVNFIQRLVVKSSNGLTLEDINDYHVLDKINRSFMDINEKQSAIIEGDYGYPEMFLAPNGRISNICDKQEVGTAYIKKFHSSGLLNPKQKAYLPLSMMNSNGAYALQIELHLAPVNDVVFRVDSAPSTAITATDYNVSDVKLNLCLVTVDKEISDKFSNIAVDDNDNVILPYNTYRNHKSSVSNQYNANVFLSESVKNLKRVYSVFHEPGNATASIFTPFLFEGGSKTLNGNNQVLKYQYRLGSKMYPNSPIEEDYDNTLSLANTLSALYKLDDGSPFVTNFNISDGEIFYERGHYILVNDFQYSADSEKGVEQGYDLYSVSLPIQLDLTFNGLSTLTVNSFVESSQNLVIKNGQVSIS